MKFPTLEMSASRRYVRPLLIALVIFALFSGLAYVGYQWARNDALAVLTRLSNSTDRDRKASVGKWFQAKRGDEFSDGDGARTAKNAEAHFQLFSGAQLTLKPASQIRFGQKGAGRRAVGLTVEVGEVDVRTAERTLTINSQFGEVVIQPNSLIRLKRNGAQMLMRVEVGGLHLTRDDANPLRYAAGDTLTLAIGGIVVEEEKGDTEPTGAGAPPAGKAEEESELELGDGLDRADLVLAPGESCTVHDPSPPTALGIRFAQACSGPARLTSGKLTTEAATQGNLLLPAGLHKYTVVCLDKPEEVAEKGTVRILKDAGTRTLPSFTPQANVMTDGRNYTVLYQSRLPQVTVAWPGAPTAAKYFLLVDGQSFTVDRPSRTLPSGRLQPGEHKLAFRAVTSPPRQSRTTTVVVKYDGQTPTARVSEPRGGFSQGGPVAFSGQALPGWSVSVDGNELALDGRRQFDTEVTPNGTVAIAFSHPKRGTHYYLRRPHKLP